MRLLIPFFMALALSAQTIPAIPQELLGKATAPAPRPKAEAQAAQPQVAVAPTVVSDGYELQVSADAPVTIAAGDFHIFDQSKLDFTGIEHARIAIQSVNSQDLTGVIIFPSWAANGTYFTVTDLSKGDGGGGLYTPTYGPYLRLGIYNGGKTAIQIRQLSIYAAK